MEDRWSTTSHTLGDGRTIAVHQQAADGPLIVFSHAAPGSGRFDPDPEVTTARGVRLLAPDRPGYGGSDPVAGEAWASVDGAADDLAAVLDSRGAGPVGVVGWSAGGRVAMALAAHRPDLVSRLVVVATPAPDEEVPWIEPALRAGIHAMRGKSASVVHSAYAEQLMALAPSEAGVDAAMPLLGTSDADADALGRPGARDRLRAMLREAFSQGATGLASDIAGYCLRPWGFDPAEVKAKTLLLYGGADPVVGSRHARWWKAQLPDARFEIAPNAGHLLIVPLWGRVLSHLAPRSRSTS